MNLSPPRIMIVARSRPAVATMKVNVESSVMRAAPGRNIPGADSAYYPRSRLDLPARKTSSV